MLRANRMANLNVTIPAASKSNSSFTLLFLRGGGGGGRGGDPRRLRKVTTCGESSWAQSRSISRWGRGRSARRQRSLHVRSSFSTESQNEDSFWEQEEGKKKLGEIEDMKELISEANKLQDAPLSSQQGQQEQLSMDPNEFPAGEPSQAQKMMEELAKKAKEQAERRKQAEEMLQLGQRAYGRGMYDRAVQLFEAALTNISSASQLGGDVQVWLAMAYEADGKHSQCIALYKKLENTHPSRSIRRQAKDLRFILEAPKLKISKEEMVSIPLIGEYNSDARTWSKMYNERRKKTIKKGKPTRDYMEDWLVWKPPRWERSPYFWVAVTVWLTLIGISLMFQD